MADDEKDGYGMDAAEIYGNIVDIARDFVDASIVSSIEELQDANPSYPRLAVICTRLAVIFNELEQDDVKIRLRVYMFCGIMSMMAGAIMSGKKSDVDWLASQLLLILPGRV